MAVTQELLRRRYTYNPETGLVYRRYRELNDCKTLGSQTQWNGMLAKPITTKGTRDGYIFTKINGKAYRLHNLIWLYMTGDWPKHTIDHVRGIKTDNRWTELNDTPDNGKNRALSHTNRSGIHGVIWNVQTNKWVVSIRNNRKLIYVYRDYDFFEACCARKSAELKFGFHKNHGRSK